MPAQDHPLTMKARGLAASYSNFLEHDDGVEDDWTALAGYLCNRRRQSPSRIILVLYYPYPYTILSIRPILASVISKNAFSKQM